MTDRERFLNCCLGRPVDHVPYWVHYEPADTIFARWREEGMPFATCAETLAALGGDVPPQVVPVVYGPCPDVGWKLLGKTEHASFYIDSWGVKHCQFQGARCRATDREYPVKTPEDWEPYKAALLDPSHLDRLAGDWLDRCRQWMDQGAPIKLGEYDEIQLLDGLESILGVRGCNAVLDRDADLAQRMLDHLTSLYLSVFARVVSAGVRVDMIHLSGRRTSTCDDASYRRFVAPAHARIREFARAHEIPVIALEADGPESFLDAAVGAGVNCLLLETLEDETAVETLLMEYPGVTVIGGFSGRAISEGAAAIDAEIERLRPAVERGRYIPTAGYGIPDCSWDDFWYYSQALKQLCGKQ